MVTLEAPTIMSTILEQPPDRHAEAILAFWFGDVERSELDSAYFVERDAMWWNGDSAMDAAVRDNFRELLVSRGGGRALDDTPRGYLASIVLLDQFPRNAFRGQAAAYAWDRDAQRLCLQGMERGFDRSLRLIERVFFCMPLEHAEDATLQAASVANKEHLLDEARRLLPAELHPHYESYCEWARRHRDTIAAFNRFPHRNALLGRRNTASEQRFLAVEHGSASAPSFLTRAAADT